MKAKLYLESTVPSYYVARPSRDVVIAARQHQTHDWWDRQRLKFDILVSQIVVDELSAGEAERAKLRLKLVAPFPLLKINEEVMVLTQALLHDGPLPAKAARDAAHIALAAVHRLHFLVTWNCKHIANPTMQRQISAVCAVHGVAAPVICTPGDLLANLIYENEGV